MCCGALCVSNNEAEMRRTEPCFNSSLSTNYLLQTQVKKKKKKVWWGKTVSTIHLAGTERVTQGVFTCRVFIPTNNNSAAHSFRSLEETNKTAGSFALLLWFIISPVFLTHKLVKSQIRIWGLPSFFFSLGGVIQFYLAVNRTQCSLFPEDGHSRALHRETLTTGPNWNFNYIKDSVAHPC